MSGDLLIVRQFPGAVDPGGVDPWRRPPARGPAEIPPGLSITGEPVRVHHEEPAGSRPQRREDSMKQYLLAVHMVEGTPAPAEAEMHRMYAQVDAFNKELMASGSWVFAGGLLPADTAAVVRAEGGKVVTTDGPFAESKEQIGGFWVIKAADQDTATEIAGRASAACEAPVEVRQFQDDPGSAE
jgi:hypothetical protein